MIRRSLTAVMWRDMRTVATGNVAPRRRCFLLAGVALLLLCGSVTAREQLSVVASPWPPYVAPGLQHSGLAVHLVTEALQRAGYGSSVTLTSWPRDLEATEQGSHDVIASVWFTEQRARRLAFSKPYIVTETHFVKRRDASHRYRTLADLRGLRIGVVKGYAYGGQADAAGLKVTPVFMGSVLDNLRSLVAGDLDLVLADDRVALYELNVNVPGGARQTFVLPKAYSSRGLRMGVSRQRQDHTEVVTRFDAAIEAMKADGRYASILAAHRVSAN
ncbi:MAG: transporter substrate-binding domain-containing protein [Gammaproteobacteria bacterium]|nr:transporter substrate-binding domain-containing protein [Gammaproteobacteria bacterium]MDJ0891562.1 transporter substrate-binding domain-containing protein [Gammaproteobacteria bacterium]